MASITHLKAQYLIQVAADTTLAPLDQTNLNNHLTECNECRQYALLLGKLQDDLRRITHYRWDRVGAQLSARAVKNRSAKARLPAYNLQTLGKFAFAMVVLAVMFILSITFSSTMNNIPAAFGGLSLTPEKPIHTPTQTKKETATDSAAPKCSDVAYIVQENDTLDSIAAKHSASKESITERNGLAADALTVNTVLIIPICKGTPVDSTITPTITTTVTPQN